MSCGGRVYKGDTVTISVPFDVDDYSNLTITYTTIGDEKIVKTQEEVEIEDGFITYTFEPGELDLLPDGVIYYTIECEVNGVPNVDSTNTNLYLKTPAGYSGLTADEIYQSGYTAGLEACSGSTDCSSAITEAYQSGYTEGYNQGQADCPECSGGTCNLQEKVFVVTDPAMENVFPDAGYDGLSQVMLLTTTLWDSAHTSGYNEGYQSGYTAGQADCPECSGSTCNIQPIKAVEPTFVDYPVDYQMDVYPDAGYDGLGRVSINKAPLYNQGYTAGYDTGFTNGYQSGYTAGQADCSGGTSCNLQDDYELYLDGSETAGQMPIWPSEGYDGISEGRVFYMEAYQNQWNSGHTSGFTDGYQSGYTEGYDDALYERCNLTDVLVVVPSGSSGVITDYMPPSGYTGFATVSVNATEYGQEMFDNGFQSGYTSGYTDGYNQGISACASELYAGYWCVDENWDGEETTLTPITHFASTAAGFSAVTISDCGYGDKRFNEGHASGYTDGHASGYTEGYDEGYLSGASTTDCSQAISTAYDNGHYLGYNEGKDSVIKSLLTENDTDLVIGYYYTSARTNCLITGEYHDSNIDYDGNSAFVSMSVNGGSWQPVEKYMELPAGWSQVRFSGCTTLLLGAFSHRFTPSQECDMDALKIVSLPTKIDGLTNTYTFHMNDGLRVIASSCGLMRGATSGADNINVLITHYTGNQRQFDYFPSNGVLFIPEGSTADWASILPNWTHIEMF